MNSKLLQTSPLEQAFPFKHLPTFGDVRDSLKHQLEVWGLHEPPVWVVRFARGVLFSTLDQMCQGQLIIRDQMGVRSFGQTCEDFPEPVTMVVRQPGLYLRFVLRQTIGVAESYMDGDWTCQDIPLLFRIILRNVSTMSELQIGNTGLLAPVYRLSHKIRANTQLGSRYNILAHYDLGNPFFALFLDSTMMYSAACFDAQTQSLEQASVAKLDLICRKLDLKPEDHLLEIGTGWGGFAIHAAKHYGCRVTTTTISDEQFQFASRKVALEGLCGQITLLKQDYRDLQGQYDKLVSIEMIEAVGYQYYDSFFSQCSRLLKQNGLMVMQAITVDDRQHEINKNTVDFIQQYIFPGGHSPSITALLESMRRSTDLRLFHLEENSPNYVRTLQEWRWRFMRNLDRVREMGYSESFIRMWEYYLCYCEAGFAERYCNSVQLVAIKPENRRAPITCQFQDSDRSRA